MAENSNIQWTEHTWNPWHGCKKVSAGCKFCYMYRDKERFNQDPTTVLRSVKATFNRPLTWKQPGLVFTCSWSDFFIDEADEWRGDAWQIIKETPWLTYQILTKRPERVLDHLPDDWGEGYENVWIGVSAEDQETLNKRVNILASIPAKTRFLSLEPLLSRIEFIQAMNDDDESIYPFDRIHWVIIGGESGNDEGKYLYRPCEHYWIDSLVYQCKYLEIPVFVKQMGTHISKQLKMKDRHGGDIDEFTKALQVREYPKTYQIK